MSKDKKYQYPFKIYFKGHDVQQPDHIFDFGVEYTEKEISTKLFQHGYKEFAGDVKYTYDEVDEMLVPDFTSQKHG